jgi:hypothetical protein
MSERPVEPHILILVGMLKSFEDSLACRSIGFYEGEVRLQRSDRQDFEDRQNSCAPILHITQNKKIVSMIVLLTVRQLSRTVATRHVRFLVHRGW